MKEDILLSMYFVQVKCPSLYTDRHENYKCFRAWWLNPRYRVSEKPPSLEEEIELRRYRISQVKCPSFKTEYDQTDTCCRPMGLNAKYGVSGKPLLWNK